MKYTLLTMIFIFPTLGNAQAIDDLFSKNIDVHVDPIPLAFVDPAIRFGSEMSFGNRWASGLNLGIGIPLLKNTNIGFADDRDMRGSYMHMDIRPEIKFYWLKRNYMGWYVGAEGILSNTKRDLGKGYHLEESDSRQQTNFDQADFQKTKIGLIGKMGGRFLINKRITLDLFTGLGYARVNNQYTNYVNPSAQEGDPFFELENYFKGKFWTAQLTAVARLGIIIWEKNNLK